MRFSLCQFISIFRPLPETNCTKCSYLHTSETHMTPSKTVLDMHTIIPPDSILVTLDVWSLYTNIPQDEGTQIC